MMLGPGSIEWGSKRSALEKFGYAAGDLALCDRHVGEWVGLMNVRHLQLGISDAACSISCARGAAINRVDLVRPQFRVVVASAGRLLDTCSIFFADA